jgi:hypothetical protein
MRYASTLGRGCRIRRARPSNVKGALRKRKRGRQERQRPEGEEHCSARFSPSSSLLRYTGDPGERRHVGQLGVSPDHLVPSAREETVLRLGGAFTAGSLPRSRAGLRGWAE